MAISDNANTVAASIRAKLQDDLASLKAMPVLDSIPGADLFVTLPCAGYIVTDLERMDALEAAKQDLIDRMTSFDFENQLAK